MLNIVNDEIIQIEANKYELLTRERHWTNEIPCVNKIKGQGLINEIGLAVCMINFTILQMRKKKGKI